MESWTLPHDLREALARLATVLQVRTAPRLQPLFSGVFFARGRRTVTSWLRAAGIGDDFRAYYLLLARLGHCLAFVAARLLDLLVCRLAVADHWLFALDDTPTKRYGPEVEGAGIHH